MIIIIIVILLIILFIYLLIIRKWQLHWGATQNEVELELLGDNFVSKPDFNATRAITIYAPPEIIWKWIMQIGSKRAGWYSIDWIDNSGVKSSETIVEAFQNIEINQFIPFTSDQKHGMWFKDFKHYEYILWVDKIGNASWLWYLITDGANKTRLVTRLRTKYVWKGFWIFYYLLFDIGDIVMMRKCMRRIKQRAEFEMQQNKSL